MKCTVTAHPGRMTIACGPRPEKQPCHNCGKEAYFQCDWVLARRPAGGMEKFIQDVVCGVWMCLKCSTRVGVGKDYCAEHVVESEREKC